MRLRFLVLGLTAFLTPLSSFAWEPAKEADPNLARALDQLKTHHSAVFVASCQFNKRLKAVAAFEAGSLKGSYLLIQDHLNDGKAGLSHFGDIKIRGGQAVVGATTGGLESGPAQARLAAEVLRLPFILLSSNELDRIYRDPASSPCPSAD